MSDQPEIDGRSLTERLVLLGIADAVVTGEAPVASWEVRRRVEPMLEHVDAEVVSTPNEADTARALNRLATGSAVDEQQSDSSPTGKGRPRYSLAVDSMTVLGALETDDRLKPAVEAVRE
ncbi:MAG: hypothetical protein V5A55_08440 [Halovenus sp.]